MAFPRRSSREGYYPGGMDPTDGAIWVVFAILDAVAYVVERLLAWMLPHGTRARRLHLTDWNRRGYGRPH
jgi:hypothetical protein